MNSLKLQIDSPPLKKVPCNGFKKRNLVLATHSDFLMPLSLQPKVKDL